MDPQPANPTQSPVARFRIKVMIGAGFFAIVVVLLLLPPGNVCYLKSNSIPKNIGVGLGAYTTSRTLCFTDHAVQQHNANICMKISGDFTLKVDCAENTAIAARDITKCAVLKPLDDRNSSWQHICEESYRLNTK
ncbi:MAG: hypothetical protein V1907_04670 [Candidatus Kerfeldbacteria bacterium]